MSTQHPNESTSLETRATGTYDQRDSLTGVRGRYTLLNDYRRVEGREVYIALADVDNFRSVNDAYGDNVGNELLRQIGQAAVERFGDDHVFRYGSDEFLIVVEAPEEGDFRSDLQLLSSDIARITCGGEPLRLTCSYGYVHGLIASSEDLHEAIRFADRKMYEAKRLGKARAVGVSLGGDPFLHNGMHSHPKAYKSYEVDELTGLANLVCFRNQLAHLVSQASPDDQLSVVFFNIENFRAFNGRFGFTAGDELLVYVADAIEKAYSGCFASRTQSDQFMVVVPQSDVVPGILQVRRAFRKRIKDSSIWLKAGYYVLAPDDSNVDLICDRAKLACDSIRGRRDVYYQGYDAELERSIALRHHILDHFDEALAKGHIKVYYQPIVRVATGAVCDEEVLARWEDPQLGIILPDVFVPVLEEARLIHRLDLYIVQRCCQNLRRTLSMGLVTDVPSISINLSRLDFELCDIVGEIERILDEHEVPRSYVSVEITESALAGNQEFLKSEIDRFRADGFEVWMDDFGSGYSSLNLLKEYSFDLVKLDMGFLRGFDDSDNARILLANIIKMAKELGLKTLVEGVETAEQMQFVKSIGCGRAQGYLISRPRSLEYVLRSLGEGVSLPIERADEREFYERLGSVNLTRPVSIGRIDGRYVASDRAAAILLRRGGRYEYLNVTDVYRAGLRAVGMDDLEKSAVHLVDIENKNRRSIDEAVERSVESGSWESLMLEGGGMSIQGYVRCIARHDELDMVGALIVIVPIWGTVASAS